jgi:hypothetical protein
MKSNKQIILILAGILVATIIVGNILLNKSNLDDSSQNWFDENTKWYKDSHTRSVVQKLHPRFRNKIAEFFTKMEKQLGLSAYATSGYRTIAEQTALHNQNPSNAKPGYSSHNFGFAIDINVKNKDGKIFLLKNTPDKQWNDSKVVQLAKDLGLSWGGGGAFGNYRDPVHFYIKPNGLSTTDLRAMYNDGKKDKEGYVLV